MSKIDFSFFLPVAMRKLNDLLNSEDFKSIENIDFLHFTVVIRFESSRCRINKFGKVEWVK